MIDVDTTDLIHWPTPDFLADQVWPSALEPPDPMDTTSVDTVDTFSEDMTCNMFPLDFGPWTPMPEAAQALPDITPPRTTKSKRLSAGLLPTPTSDSSSTQESCSCLQHVVFIVHELETAKLDSVDGQMASHKEAMDYGQAMMVCGLCSRRPENLMMLTFLSEGLLQLSEAVLRRLTQGEGEERLAIMFGEFEIDSAPEWELLVSSLAVMQVGALRCLLSRLKKSAETVQADVVYKKVVTTERLTGELMERLRSKIKPMYYA